MHRVGGLLAVALVLVVLGAPTAGAQSTPALTSPDAAQQSFTPSVTTLTVGLQADGDATWTVEYRIHLADENDTQAFESLQADIRENRTGYTDRFASRMGTTVQSAEDATGRSMTLRNVTVETGVESVTRYGVVTYRFEWTNFAAVDGEEVRAGDAVAGLYLDESTTLRFTAPDGYHAASVQPPPTESRPGIVVWEGERTFTDAEPLVTYAPAPTTTATTGPTATTGGGTTAGGTTPGGTTPGGTTPGGTTPGGTTPGGGSGGTAPLLALVAVVVVLAGAGLAVWYARGGGNSPDGDGGSGATPDEASAGGDGGPDTDAAAATAEPTDDSEPDAEAAPDEEDVPPELLSNEERVLALLSDRGGRIKQQEVVSALDWTEAKTSQVLNEMHETGEIEKFRLGRENVIKLPEGDEE